MQTLSQTRSSTLPQAAPTQMQAGDYLEKLHLLIQEMHVAMGAIGSRELPTLEESISRQQSLCARLSEAPLASIAQPSFLEASGSSQDFELAERIRAATATLVRLNKSYSRLLQHSAETVRLFKGLYNGYAGRVQDASLRWSCEL